jgi:hypothetical protein
MSNPGTNMRSSVNSCLVWRSGPQCLSVLSVSLCGKAQVTTQQWEVISQSLPTVNALIFS